MITEVENYSYSRHASPRLGSRTTSCAESKRCPAQILAAYRRHNPRRQLDWRWQRASELIKYGEEPDPAFDDGWTRRSFEYRRMTADHSAEELADAMPDIHAACQLNATGGVACWELEARVLARETPQAIESKTAIAAPVVECYERLFFGVLARIDCKTYITANAIGQRPFDGHDVPAIWNHFGYWYGPHFLDVIIDDFRETGKPDYTHLSSDRDWWKSRSRFQRTLDRSIALLMFEINSRNVVALFRTQGALTSLQQRGEPLAQHDCIENLVDEAMGDLFSLMSETDLTEELVA